MAEQVDCVVIGAGVVGLACARALAMAGREVIVLEAEDLIGSHTSSRNSEVIHAGIYYPTDSLRAEVCVRGKHALYDYCESHGVPHKRVMKVIVASEESEIPKLKALQRQAADNGVRDLEYLDAKAVTDLEPAVVAKAGLLSPSTGIIDSHSLMVAYLGDAEEHGAMLALRSPVLGGKVTARGVVLDVGGDTPMSIECRTVINSAGLGAQRVASAIEGVPLDSIPTLHLAKGNYYSMLGKQPFSHLVYPMPAAGVLGVHVTIDLSGRCRFGPDLEYIDELNYDVDPARAQKFYDAVRSYFPDLKDDSLQPDYCGVRPKLHALGQPQPDFMIQGQDIHGVPGLVNLYGIESPGLTASLALGEIIARRIN
ncbi:MAG: NAD(P)/FAD-dependent oxidoreductase [Gammaproteobacteria bacterium]|nr:NAD(P)/FAD-dependent oxidoreductase [Gammaproteobacteria bacterium]